MDIRLGQLEHWLTQDLGFSSYEIEPASADASFRRYFRVRVAEESHIVMDAPPDKEDCRPFLDVSARLLDCKLNVPHILAENLQEGFLLLSDLGSTLYLDALNLKSADDLYTAAIDALVTMQCEAETEGLPHYDEHLLLKEMSLFGDWLLDRHLSLADKERYRLDDLMAFLLQEVLAQSTCFVHRDFHSRNLLVCPHNPGIIDYQDAVLGPLTYDLVSLFKDSYVKWDQKLIDKWMQTFHHKLGERGVEVPGWPVFRRWIDMTGVQRELKVGGIFARLYHRDGKAAYLKDIPRTLSYITDLKGRYEELEELINLLEQDVLPALKEAQ